MGIFPEAMAGAVTGPVPSDEIPCHVISNWLCIETLENSRSEDREAPGKGPGAHHQEEGREGARIQGHESAVCFEGSAVPFQFNMTFNALPMVWAMAWAHGPSHHFSDLAGQTLQAKPCRLKTRLLF